MLSEFFYLRPREWIQLIVLASETCVDIQKARTMDIQCISGRKVRAIYIRTCKTPELLTYHS
jgi:hypothetical protein